MKKSVSNWFLNIVENNGPLTVLQVVYGVVGLAFLVIAGLVGILNHPLGGGLLIVPLVCFVALGMNVIVWALIRLLVDVLAASKMREIARAEAERKEVAKKARTTKKKPSKKSTKK